MDVENVSAAFALDAPIASLAPAAAYVQSGVWVARPAASGGAASGSAAAAAGTAAGSSRPPAPAVVRFEGPEGPLGSCAWLSLRSLTVNSATPNGYGVLATVCQLSGVNLAVDHPHAAGTAGL